MARTSGGFGYREDASDGTALGARHLAAIAPGADDWRLRPKDVGPGGVCSRRSKRSAPSQRAPATGVFGFPGVFGFHSVFGLQGSSDFRGLRTLLVVGHPTALLPSSDPRRLRPPGLGLRQRLRAQTIGGFGFRTSAPGGSSGRGQTAASATGSQHRAARHQMWHPPASVGGSGSWRHRPRAPPPAAFTSLAAVTGGSSSRKRGSHRVRQLMTSVIGGSTRRHRPRRSTDGVYVVGCGTMRSVSGRGIRWLRSPGAASGGTPSGAAQVTSVARAAPTVSPSGAAHVASVTGQHLTAASTGVGAGGFGLRRRQPQAWAVSASIACAL